MFFLQTFGDGKFDSWAEMTYLGKLPVTKFTLIYKKMKRRISKAASAASDAAASAGAATGSAGATTGAGAGAGASSFLPQADKAAAAAITAIRARDLFICRDLDFEKDNFPETVDAVSRIEQAHHANAKFA